MKDLIEALTIFLKYANEHNPTNCCHDVLVVVGVPKDIAAEDAARVQELGFFWSKEYDGWSSFRFGSA